MKPFTLAKILDTTRPICEEPDYIAVGSPLCHDLLSVNKKTLKIKYALDFDLDRKGRDALKFKPELAELWDKLQSLIDSGEIKEIIEGVDTHPSPVTLYEVKGREVVERLAHPDFLEYPNCTLDGSKIYENTHFKNREDAENQLASNLWHEREFLISDIESRRKETEKREQRLHEINKILMEDLNRILTSLD